MKITNYNDLQIGDHIVRLEIGVLSHNISITDGLIKDKYMPNERLGYNNIKSIDIIDKLNKEHYVNIEKLGQYGEILFLVDTNTKSEILSIINSNLFEKYEELSKLKDGYTQKDLDLDDKEWQDTFWNLHNSGFDIGDLKNLKDAIDTSIKINENIYNIDVTMDYINTLKELLNTVQNYDFEIFEKQEIIEEEDIIEEEEDLFTLSATPRSTGDETKVTFDSVFNKYYKPKVIQAKCKCGETVFIEKGLYNSTSCTCGVTFNLECNDDLIEDKED